MTLAEARSKADIREACRNSLSNFARFFFKMKRPWQPFQFQMMDWWAARKDQNAAVFAPRGSYKSTLLLLIYLCWRLCYDRDYTGGICRTASELAVEGVREVRRMLESPLIVEVFGPVVDPHHKALATGFNVLGRTLPIHKDPNCFGMGFLQPRVQGTHPREWILDDAWTYGNTRTPQARASHLQWFRSQLYFALETKGQGIKILNTFWHPQDLGATLVKGMLVDCHLRVPAQNPDGSSIWPDVWPNERGKFDDEGKPLLTLQEERELLGEVAFRNQLLCDPFFREDLHLDPEQFLYWTEPEQLPAIGRGAIVRYGLDPGGTGRQKKERSPWFGLVRALGHAATKTQFVTDAVMRRLSLHQQADLVEEYYRQLPGLITFERNGLGVGLYEELRRRGIPSRAPHVSDDPDFRASIISLRVDQKLIVFSRKHTDLLRQLSEAPDGRPNDLVNALYYALETVEPQGGWPSVVDTTPPFDLPRYRGGLDDPFRLPDDVPGEVPEDPAEWHRLAEAPVEESLTLERW